MRHERDGLSILPGVKFGDVDAVTANLSLLDVIESRLLSGKDLIVRTAYESHLSRRDIMLVLPHPNLPGYSATFFCR